MPISGLMVTLDDDPRLRAKAVEALEASTAFDVGLREGLRLAAVLDTPTEDENRRLWRWLNDLPGVSYVDVLFIHLDDATANAPLASQESIPS